MLIIQKLEMIDTLSNSEKSIADYLVKNQNKILKLSVTQIAKESYCSPSAIVRLSNKLGFKGWKELKTALVEENKYINSPSTIDANMPFNHTDNFKTISENVAQLCIESIQDTINLLEHDSLQKATYMLLNAKIINIYGITNTIACAHDFALKMRTIGRIVNIYDNPEDFPYIIEMTNKDICSLFISYSGETPELLEYVTKLKDRNLPTLAITSIGNNTLNTLCNCTLFTSTKEKMYSKISNFSSNQSIVCLLNILYSCIFSKNYDENWNHRIYLAKKIEYKRQSNVSILKEQD